LKVLSKRLCNSCAIQRMIYFFILFRFIFREETMSEAPKKRPKVPEGKSRFVTTRQKEPNEKGFVGYETIWEPPHKVVEYTTPKKP
jgi:hypothetical protein